MRGFIEQYKDFLASLPEPQRHADESDDRFNKRYGDWQEHYRKLVSEFPEWDPATHKPVRLPDGTVVDENEEDDGLPEVR